MLVTLRWTNSDLARGTEGAFIRCDVFPASKKKRNTTNLLLLVSRAPNRWLRAYSLSFSSPVCVYILPLWCCITVISLSDYPAQVFNGAKIYNARRRVPLKGDLWLRMSKPRICHPSFNRSSPLCQSSRELPCCRKMAKPKANNFWPLIFSEVELCALPESKCYAAVLHVWHAEPDSRPG